jgi:hypothetical protein
MTRQSATQKQQTPTTSLFYRGSILQRKCESCGQHTIAGGECRECAKKKSGLQRKLAIGASNDPLEWEADRVAAEVIRMPGPPAQRESLSEDGTQAVQTKPIAISSVNGASPQQKCSECEQEGQVQRSGKGTSEVGSDIESRLSSKGGGSPLSDKVRSFMEPRFGTDFSGVRVHTGSESVQMNRDLNAQAFTHGQDVYFGSGKAPGNDVLTAHELTHVVQQGHGGSRLQRWDTDNAPIGDPNRDPRLAHLRPTRSLSVTAIDDVDSTGWIESFLTIGEINFTDLPSMVKNILTGIGSTLMNRLNIQVHGSPSAVAIGNTVVTASNFSTHQPQLARLSSHFTSGGFVHLRACDVGQNLPLMQLFAATFGVPVYAGRGKQNNIFGLNMGYIVRCQPDGTYTTQFFQP